MQVGRSYCLAATVIVVMIGCAPCNRSDFDSTAYRDGEGVRFELMAQGQAATDRASTGGVSLVDYDGDQDLVVANWGSAPAIHLNDGAGAFTTLDVTRLGAGIAFASSVAGADLDGDGLLDIVFGSWPNRPGSDEENILLANRSTARNWLEVQLEGTLSNRAGIGARVEVTTPEGRQIREVQAHNGWRSQGDLVQHFGLGSNTTVTIAVQWPSGNVDERAGVDANQRIVIIEGS